VDRRLGRVDAAEVVEDRLGRRGVDVEVTERRVAAAGGRELEALEGVDVGGAELADELLDVTHAECVVERHGLGGGVDEAQGGGGVADAPVDGTLGGAADEVLLAADAAEVARRVTDPLAVLLVFEVARPGVGQGLDGVEGDAPGLLQQQSGVGVTDGRGEVDRHALQHLDEVPESLEVDLDVVLDGDAEVRLDRLDEIGGAIGTSDGGVDLRLAARRLDRHVAVTGDRQQRRGLRPGVDPEDHDHIGEALTLEAAVADRVGGGETVGVVGPDEEDVLGLVLRHLRGEGQPDRHHRDVGQLGPDEGEPGTDGDTGDHHQEIGRDEQPLRPGPVRAARAALGRLVGTRHVGRW